MIDIFKKFIEDNPSKVLGVKKDTTDRFGNPDIKIVGGIEELTKIDVSEANIPNKNHETENIDVAPVNLDKRLENVKQSLQKTKEQAGKVDRKQKKAKKKKQKANKYLLEGDDTQEVFSGDEAFNKLNPQGFDEDFLSVWYWYHQKIGKPLHSYFAKFRKEPTDTWFELNLKNGNLCFDPETNSYIPSVLYYSGNIYDRILAINKAQSTDQLKKQLKQLKNILPTPLKLTGKEDERLVIDVLSKFSRETEIDSNGEFLSITKAFKAYLRQLDRDETKYGISPYKVVSYHIDRDRFPNNTPAYEKAEIKRKGALESEYQMAKFLAYEITPEDREKIELKWNRENNGFVDINYNNVPLYFECSKFFKESDLQIRPAQREGVAFSLVNGTGIIAYDVGVGKTLTSILTVGNAIQSGLCKRPLIVVPKQTYDKWIGEIRGVYDDDGNLLGSGVLPQYPIYDLFNLSKKIGEDIILDDGKIKDLPETCILMATYEGMSNIGFGQEETSSFMAELKEILNQGFGDESERQKALDDEKLNKKIGVGIEGTKVNIEDIEADFLVIDEAHNMNKIFSNVKGEVVAGAKRESSPYQIQGSESARGIKAFFISNYIQRNSKGNGNICLLTATPFTNSPLEVFNMLALTNVKRLAQMGIKNVSAFFDNYVNQTYEKVVKQSGEIVESAVIKGWSNKVALQKILFNYMNYKSGEDANIKRPIKWTLPKLSEEINGVRVPLALDKQIPTYLQPTPEQKQIQLEIGEWLVDQMNDSVASKKAPHLVADIKAKKNCISPYIYKGTPPENITPKQFIESSPKLKYTMECIKSVIDWHKKDGSPLSCQVIYINGGINYMLLVKRYLEEELGYKKQIAKNGKNKHFDEVEVLVGGGADTPKELKRNDDEKEAIKDLFLNGKVKVIIGSSTIREGIDLQKKSSVLYNLWVDWNPTDYKQLEGRVWRFGNIFANVRIVTPLLVGSSDAFTFQKLEEKTARINDIFDRNDRSNILQVGEEDREEVKWALIDDLEQVAKAKIKDMVAEKQKQEESITSKVELLQSIDYNMREMKRYEENIARTVETYWKHVADKYAVQELEEDYDKLKMINRNKKLIAEITGRNPWYINSDISGSVSNWGKFKKLGEKLEKLDDQTQQEYGISIYEDATPIIDKLNEQKEGIANEIAELKSEGYLMELTESLEKERKKFNSGIQSFDVTVDRFKDLNYLLGILKQVDQKPVKTVSEAVKQLPEAIDTEDAVEVAGTSKVDEMKQAVSVLKTLQKHNPDDEKINQALKVLEIMLKNNA